MIMKNCKHLRNPKPKQLSFTPFILVLMIIVSCSSTHQSGVYYVDASSSMQGNGSMKSPFQTIQEGVNSAQPGETIVVLPGIYNESVTTQRNGLPDAPITIRSSISADAPENAEPGWTLENQNDRVWISYPGRGIDIVHSYIHIDGINVDGMWHSNSYIDDEGF